MYRFIFFTLYYFIVFISKYRNSVVSVIKNEIYACANSKKNITICFSGERSSNREPRVFLHSVHVFVVCVIIMDIYTGVKIRYWLHSTTLKRVFLHLAQDIWCNRRMI